MYKSFVCRLQKQQKQSQFTQKRGMVRGILIVFCWYHEAQTTKTKYHKQTFTKLFFNTDESSLFDADENSLSDLEMCCKKERHTNF